MLSKTKNLNEKEFKDLLLNLQEAYENDEPQISDEEFDYLVRAFERKFDTKYTEVGAKQKGKQVELPYPLWSLDKAKDVSGDGAAEKALESFKKKNKGPW